MAFSPVSMFTDFGIISFLMIFAHFLRSRSKILQAIYIPSAVLAGLFGLILGKQFLDVLPFSLNEAQALNIGFYPAFLVVLLFASIFLGNRKKKISVKNTIEHAGDTFFFNLASILGQYGFTLLFALVVLYPLFPNLHQAFCLLLPAGFVGGHGTAAAIGSTLESYGLLQAQSIGYVSATVGILVGIIGGMIFINLGTRKEWTRLIKSTKDMPISLKTGFIPKEEQASLGKETTSSMAIDPLTWHLALVVFVASLAFNFTNFIQNHFHLSVPTFCLALFIGAFLQKFLSLINVGQYVDRHTVNRIGSMVTDYLVAFSVASISVKVVFEHALPLILMFSFGTFLTVSFVWYLGRRMCKNFWFERSMLMFGWNTGTVAMSMVLVRILDPDMQSGVLEDFGISYFGVAFVEIAIISLLPHFIAQGIIFWPMVLLLSAFFLCIFLSKVLVGWFTASPTKIRTGEPEIMANSITE